MAVVHRVRLIEPEFDRISLLCFLSDDAGPTALGDESPRVVNLKTRIIDAPTDFPARARRHPPCFGWENRTSSS